MKKSIRKPIAITAAVVAVVAITVLVLSLVRIDPIGYFEGYRRVAVVTSKDSEASETPEKKEKLAKELEGVKFSVMHAILEGKFSYAPKLIKEDKETKMLSAAEIANLAPAEGEVMLRFYYDEPRTIKVGGESVMYDRVVIKLTDGGGEVVKAVCTAYLDANIGNVITSETPDENGVVGSAYYKVPQFTLRMLTSDLYNAVAEMM